MIHTGVGVEGRPLVAYVIIYFGTDYIYYFDLRGLFGHIRMGLAHRQSQQSS